MKLEQEIAECLKKIQDLEREDLEPSGPMPWEQDPELVIRAGSHYKEGGLGSILALFDSLGEKVRALIMSRLDV